MKINWEKEEIIGFYLYFCHVNHILIVFSN